MMRNYILFFEEKEGTSPIVQLIDNFLEASVVRQISSGWEPFDQHNCGAMTLDSLEQCLNMIYGQDPIDMDRLNYLYTKTAKAPLMDIRRDVAVGFKMRFVPPRIDLPVVGGFPTLRYLAQYKSLGFPVRWLGRLVNQGPFQRMMFDLLKKHNVIVFMAFRQDVLRWALSKYHGDGTGRPGHLQHKLANAKIRREDIPRLKVNCSRLKRIIQICEKSLERKRALIEKFNQLGIDAHPICYEDFVSDQHRFLEQVFLHLEIQVSEQEITDAIKKGCHYQRVHSEDISDYVINHREVLDRFEGRYVSYS